MKTTVYGLTSCSPNYCIITISGNKGILGTTQEHLLIAKALKLTIIIVVTKSDICTKTQLADTISLIETTVGAIPLSFIPMIVDTNDKVINISSNLNQAKSKLLPIFVTSSVSGQGLELLTNFLNYLPTKKFDKDDRLKPVNFQIDTYWYQEANLATKRLVKIHGRLLSGVIKTGETVRVGSDTEGNFHPARIEYLKV
jgi:GTPase